MFLYRICFFVIRVILTFFSFPFFSKYSRSSLFRDKSLNNNVFWKSIDFPLSRKSIDFFRENFIFDRLKIFSFRISLFSISLFDLWVNSIFFIVLSLSFIISKLLSFINSILFL